MKSKNRKVLTYLDCSRTEAKMIQRSSTHATESKRMLKDERVQRFERKGSNPSASALAYQRDVWV